MKIIKALGIFSGILVLIPAIYFSVLFFQNIYPYLNEIDQMVAAESEPPAELYFLALVAESKEGIAWYTGRLLGNRYQPGTRASRFLWPLIIPRIYSEQELFKLWVRLSPCGYKLEPGLRVAAQAHFGKELNQLSRRQLAELVAAVRGPSAFRPGSEHLAKRVEWLLAQEAAANKSFKADALRARP